MTATPITPETKVGAFLDAYPELESRLIELAPEFKKLKNPVLRRTVAKVATLAQAARVAGLNPRELVMALREAAGQSPLDEGTDQAPQISAENDWILALPVVVTLDADQLLAAGLSPLQSLNQQLSRLNPGEAVAITSSFVPAPLIDAVAARGFMSHTYEVGPQAANPQKRTLIAHKRD